MRPEGCPILFAIASLTAARAQCPQGSVRVWEITVPPTAYDETLMDFPVPVRIPPTLDPTMLTAVRPDGTVVPVELEPGTPRVLWTPMTLRPDAPTSVDLCSVRPLDAPVWDASFVLVYHLADWSLDSANGDLGTVDVSPTIQLGIIGDASRFAGEGHGIDTHIGTYLATWTLEAWVRPDALPRNTHRNGLVMRDDNFELAWDHDVPEYGPGNVGFREVGNPVWHSLPHGEHAVGVWAHVAGVFDGTTLTTYRNGVEVARESGIGSQPVHVELTTKIGRHGSVADPGFEGVLDEVRVSSVARSPTWIRATVEFGNGTRGAQVRLVPPPPTPDTGSPDTDVPVDTDTDDDTGPSDTEEPDGVAAFALPCGCSARQRSNPWLWHLLARR